MKTHWRLSAGVLDAGLGSVATFTVGIYAVRSLDPELLGAYALAFSAFTLAALVPRELVFVPAEVAAVRAASATRLSLLPDSMRTGTIVALAAALLVSLWYVSAPAETPAAFAIAMTATAIACTFLSPLQDHMRRMFHIGGRSWMAVGTSAMQVTGVIGSLAAMIVLDVPSAWIPFGALAMANLLSLCTGAVLLRLRPGIEQAAERLPGLVDLVRTGWVLLVGALLAPGSGFVAAVIVANFAGAAALGYAEAARVLARPFPVLAAGLAAVVRPQSIEAAQKRSRGTARKASAVYLKLFVGCGVLYLLVVGGDFPWNPIPALLPNAYAVAGLVAVTAIGEILSVIQLPYRYELIGGGRGAALGRVEAVGATLRCATAATAGVTQAFAMPLGYVAVAATRAVGYRRALRSVYEPEVAPVPSETAGETRIAVPVKEV